MGQRSTSRAETWTKCYPGLNHAPVGHFIFGFCKFVTTTLTMFVGHWMFWEGESAGIMPVRGNHGGFLIYSTTPLQYWSFRGAFVRQKFQAQMRVLAH